MKNLFFTLVLDAVFALGAGCAKTVEGNNNTFLICLIFIFLIVLCAKLTTNTNDSKKEKQDDDFEEITINIGDVKLSGVSFKNLDGTSRQTIIKKCIRLSNRYSEHDVSFNAEFEEDNEYDKNAIMVEAIESWYLKNGDSKEKYLGVIGYIPKEVAADINEKLSKLPYTMYVHVKNVSFKEITSETGKQLVGVKLFLYLGTYRNNSKKPSDNVPRCPYCWADCSNKSDGALCSVCGHELTTSVASDSQTS